VHEYSIVQALVERVGAEARARRATAVHRLAIRIGELSGVEPELLRTAYETFRERTICEGAALDVQVVAARWECPGCGRAVGRGELEGSGFEIFENGRHGNLRYRAITQSSLMFGDAHPGG